MKPKTKPEIEAIGLQFLRQHQDRKLLSNTCVDCFVYGYKWRQDEEEKAMSDPVSRIDDWLESVSARLSYLADCAGYSGRGPTEVEQAEAAVLRDMYRFFKDVKEGDHLKRYQEETSGK